MKEWIDLNAQVKKHIDRGLNLESISHDTFAMFLYSNNYYRVSGYGRCFYRSEVDRYIAGTTADALMDVYDLDRVIRNSVLDGVSVLEPVLRSRVAYHVSKIFGGGAGYLDPSFYLPEGPEPDKNDEAAHKRWVKERDNRDKVLESFTEVQGRNEIFIRHHVNKGDPVPFWAVIEVVSMGTFSRFLRALRDKAPLAPVTKSLDLEDDKKLQQAVQNITFLRNIAAHHGRLWHRSFEGHVTLPKVALSVKRQYLNPKTPAAALTLLAGLVDQIEKSNEYSTNLLNLVHSDSRFTDGYYYPKL